MKACEGARFGGGFPLSRSCGRLWDCHATAALRIARPTSRVSPPRCALCPTQGPLQNSLCCWIPKRSSAGGSLGPQRRADAWA